MVLAMVSKRGWGAVPRARRIRSDGFVLCLPSCPYYNDITVLAQVAACEEDVSVLLQRSDQECSAVEAEMRCVRSRFVICSWFWYGSKFWVISRIKLKRRQNPKCESCCVTIMICWVWDACRRCDEELARFDGEVRECGRAVLQVLPALTWLILLFYIHMVLFGRGASCGGCHNDFHFCLVRTRLMLRSTICASNASIW